MYFKSDLPEERGGCIYQDYPWQPERIRNVGNSDARTECTVKHDKQHEGTSDGGLVKANLH
jgi:hypothetical protein